ncbi:hypothetical protein BC943DRAFT_313878 [Umbelopsis sp. AD052]|nr:hypothetical protein BC943DRAFT_313878 [Umbelopsis sp. AD052]
MGLAVKPHNAFKVNKLERLVERLEYGRAYFCLLFAHFTVNESTSNVLFYFSSRKNL